MSLLTGNKSSHMPGVAGNVDSVTGTLTVDTGLRKLRSFGANLNQAAAAASATANAVLLAQGAGETAKLRLEVREDDTTTISAAAASVSWFAIGE